MVNRAKPKSGKSTYVFRRTQIMEGGLSNLDRFGEPRVIRASSERRARKKLPPAGSGRFWVLTKVAKNE